MIWKVALHPADWERASWDLGGDSEGIRKVIGAVIEMRWWILTREMHEKDDFSVSDSDSDFQLPVSLTEKSSFSWLVP